jgi:glutamate 5-kinase
MMASRLIVVKIGTGSLTTEEGKLDEGRMRSLSGQIIEAVKRGNKIVLVTSGAVAAGIAELEIRPNPNDIVLQQVSAATGQSVLMAKYRDLFKGGGLRVAQILLTAEDLSNRRSYLHTCNVLKMLLKIGVLPIINENDVTSVDELIPLTEGYRVNFSDNDILSALVANAIKANLLIILSDVDGLFTKDPQEPDSTLIKMVERITPELKRSLSGKGRFGRGGIQSKIRAAEIAVKSGIPVMIANSRRDNVILDILAGIGVGTYFKPEENMPAFKRWIAYGASVKGQIFVNEGAKEAILKKSSLLPVGITRVVGQFNAGDVVGIVGQDEVEFAKGNPNYSSDEINKIKGLQASEIENKLGLARPKEVIGRKKMHLIASE